METMRFETTADVEITIYRVECDCGETLEFEAGVDSDGDILVGVRPHLCEQEVT